MKWNNLKSFLCPKCESPLSKTEGILTFDYECSSKCGFSCSSTRFDEIVGDMYRQKPRRCGTFEENLSEINNLGRREVSEDFEDSPFADRQPIIEEDI